MPVERGIPSGSRRPKDATPDDPVDLEAEYARIQKGVLAAMARGGKPLPQDPATQNEITTINAYNVLVKGTAAEEQITHIAGRIPDVGSSSQFAVAFQMVVLAIRPTGNGIAEVPDKGRTLYMAVPLKTARGERIRDDVPTNEEI